MRLPGAVCRYLREAGAQHSYPTHATRYQPRTSMTSSKPGLLARRSVPASRSRMLLIEVEPSYLQNVRVSAQISE